MTHKTIVVDDDPQFGSMLEFPLTGESAAVVVTDATSAEGSRHGESITPSALVVDDDPDIRSMLALFLKLEGFEVSAASDGVSALEVLKSKRPDVILLDLMMPGLNGYEVMEHLRGEDVPHVPVIVLTAKTGDEDVWEGWCRGADSYITKPIDIELLYQEIGRVTAGRCAA